ncbi:IS3 family transposase [Streptomyces sp. NBC_00104]|uniref:IS3 family transposase n=1 Tax=Streptomyces sp. NBC_00104 TaxID=2903621 RepID=UPI00324EED1C
MRTLLDEHPHLGVEPVLRELHIPSSTYYRWRQAEKDPCERIRQDTELTGQIRQIHQDSGGIYGSPRIHAVLKREGVHVGRKRVERLMRQAGLAGISPRRSKGFTRRDPDADPAPDLVQRDFTAHAPNRLWVTDLTMIPTLEGPLWLSAIRDAFSRRVVAWETSARADADLVLTSLEYALASREVAPGKLVHHADHGTQGGFNRSSQHLDHGGARWGVRQGGRRRLRGVRRCARQASRRSAGRWNAPSGRRSPKG